MQSADFILKYIFPHENCYECLAVNCNSVIDQTFGKSLDKIKINYNANFYEENVLN